MPNPPHGYNHVMRLFPLLVVALPLLPALADPPKPAPPTIERSEVEVSDPKLKTDIENCIRRGVNWLKDRQEPAGSWPGLDPGPVYGGGGTSDPYIPELTALALLALLKCEVPPNDPCITKGFAWLKKQNFITGAYGCATTLMALEAKYAPKESLAGRDGKKRSAKPKPIQPGPDDAVWAARLMNQILSYQATTGGWRYSGAPPDAEGGKPGLADVSATQYALMGLKTARRMGIPVKIEAFQKASDFLMDQQETDGRKVSRVTERARAEQDNPQPEGQAAPEADGGYGKDRTRGFPYMKNNIEPRHRQASAAMTCAGVVGMLICRSECLEDKGLKKEERAKRLARTEQSIYDGLAWLDAHWSVGQNFPCGAHELGYYLYGLERLGVMADLRFIGPKHDWYLEGARVWTSRMQKEGNDKGFWAIGQGRPKIETQDTPYGLLFLRKASIRLGYAIGEVE